MNRKQQVIMAIAKNAAADGRAAEFFSDWEKKSAKQLAEKGMLSLEGDTVLPGGTRGIKARFVTDAPPPRAARKSQTSRLSVANKLGSQAALLFLKNPDLAGAGQPALHWATLDFEQAVNNGRIEPGKSDTRHWLAYKAAYEKTIAKWEKRGVRLRRQRIGPMPPGSRLGAEAGASEGFLWEETRTTSKLHKGAVERRKKELIREWQMLKDRTAIYIKQIRAVRAMP